VNLATNRQEMRRQRQTENARHRPLFFIFWIDDAAVVGLLTHTDWTELDSKCPKDDIVSGDCLA
jgi:hypothetical protein